MNITLSSKAVPLRVTSARSLTIFNTVRSHPEVTKAYQKGTQLSMAFLNLVNKAYFKYLWINYFNLSHDTL